MTSRETFESRGANGSGLLANLRCGTLDIRTRITQHKRAFLPHLACYKCRESALSSRSGKFKQVVQTESSFSQLSYPKSAAEHWHEGSRSTASTERTKSSGINGINGPSALPVGSSTPLLPPLLWCRYSSYSRRLLSLFLSFIP